MPWNVWQAPGSPDSRPRRSHSDALGGRAVGEGLGLHAPRRQTLEPVVADRGGRAQPRLGVARLEQSLLGPMMAPDAGEAVRLELEAHGQLVALRFRSALLDAADLALDAHQVLDVVADLMRDDVRAGEVAGRSEALRELVEERKVEIDLAVVRAVERPLRRRPAAAGRLRQAGVEDELRELVGLSRLREDLRPGVLGVGEHDGDELLSRIVGRGCARRARRRGSAGLGGGWRTGSQELQDPDRVVAGQPADRERDEDRAAPERDAAAAEPALVFDLVALAAAEPPHRALIPRTERRSAYGRAIGTASAVSTRLRPPRLAA